ncbi:MAG: 50S ribosomal protein L10 [Patescibacteria group bacterium]
MAQTKQQKVEVVKKLEDAFKTAATTVFVHFKGVNITEETQMRRELRGADVKYTVAKKTLIKRALEALGHKADDVPMDGEIALAYGGGDDVTAPARLMHEYGKKFLNAKKEAKLFLVGGLFDGKLVGQAIMQDIALIPSMQGLRGMFANVINSPIQRFAIAMSEVAKTKTQ